MAKPEPRKFRDIVSVLGISIIAIMVVAFVSWMAYNAGYKDGVTDYQQWLLRMQHSSAGSSYKEAM